jgi:hypothetical protein
MLDMVASKRGRGWDWRINDPSGKTVLRGREAKRTMARYQAARAIFLLLMIVRMPQPDREGHLQALSRCRRP